MKTSLAFACGILLLAQCARSEESVTVVKIVGFDESAVFEVKTRAELSALKEEIKEETRFIPQALAAARKEWEGDSKLSKYRFPSGAVKAREAESVSRLFSNRADAEKLRFDMQTREMERKRKQESRKLSDAEKQEKANDAKALKLFVAHLALARPQVQVAAAPGNQAVQAGAGATKKEQVASAPDTQADQPGKAVAQDSKTAVSAVSAEKPQESSAPVSNAQAPKADAAAAKKFAAAPGRLPIKLLSLLPALAEYGTLTDPNNIQTDIGPWKIDTTPVRDEYNAKWFWPNALKIIEKLPDEIHELPKSKAYSSSMTDIFLCGTNYYAGVCLWGRTRNMYHWVEYAIPKGATKFTADVMISDDTCGWFAGVKDAMNQEFNFYVTVDSKEVARKGAARFEKRNGSGEKLTTLDISLPPDSEIIRFVLEISPWGSGNKNIELIITEGIFRN